MTTATSPSIPNGPQPTPVGWHRAIVLAVSDIKLAHTVFALPFAVLGAVLATPALRTTDSSSGGADAAGRWRTLGLQLLLIVVSMFFARSWAMLVNRLADWKFDRDNPRTARRAIARGELSPRAGLLVALGAAACFLGACALFYVFFRNPWPLILGAPVLAWIAFYSFTKRFTALCHLFLGGALAASPIAAGIAIDPSIYASPALAPARTIICLAGMVLFWVAGFDVAYALQDLDFDRRTGLNSIPARLGVGGSLWVSRLFHLVAFAFLVLAWRGEPRFGLLMVAAMGVVGGILTFEHIVLAKRGVAGLPLAFFTLNGVISLLLGATGCIDAAW